MASDICSSPSIESLPLDYPTQCTVPVYSLKLEAYNGNKIEMIVLEKQNDTLAHEVSRSYISDSYYVVSLLKVVNLDGHADKQTKRHTEE